MIASAKKYIAVFAGAALIAVAVSACGGGGAPTTNVTPTNGTPTAVDLSGVTPDFMAEAGTLEIGAGESVVHGDIAFSCAIGGDNCTVMVMLENGEVTATSTGGTVTATDSPSRELGSGRSLPQGDPAAWADKFDLVANDTRTDGSEFIGAKAYFERSVAANVPDSLLASHATLSHSYDQGSSANVIVSHDGDGQLQFNVSIYEYGPPTITGDYDVRTYRYINTYEDSQNFEGVTVSRSSITNHGLGSDWQVEELTNDYENGGSLSIYIATDLKQSDMATDPTATASEITQDIRFNVSPGLQAGQDAVQIWLASGGSISGSVDGREGNIHCPGGTHGGCVFIRNHSAEGFYSEQYAVWRPALEFGRPGQEGTRVTIEPREYDDRSVTADYLAFGNWLYVPEDETDTLDYDFGVFASGGDPFDLQNLEGLSGTATYEGDATGTYYVNRLASNPDIGSFVADVALTADFGTSSEHGTVSGEVSNFVFDGDASSSLPATVALTPNVYDWIAESTYIGIEQGETNIFGPSRNQVQTLIAFYNQPGGWVEGLTSASVDGEAWQGRWNAKFYGNGTSSTDHPTSVAGVFGSSSNTSGLAGSFGAHKQ